MLLLYSFLTGFPVFPSVRNPEQPGFLYSEFFGIPNGRKKYITTTMTASRLRPTKRLRLLGKVYKDYGEKLEVECSAFLKKYDSPRSPDRVLVKLQAPPNKKVCLNPETPNASTASWVLSKGFLGLLYDANPYLHLVGPSKCHDLDFAGRHIHCYKIHFRDLYKWHDDRVRMIEREEKANAGPVCDTAFLDYFMDDTRYAHLIRVLQKIRELDNNLATWLQVHQILSDIQDDRMCGPRSSFKWYRAIILALGAKRSLQFFLLTGKNSGIKPLDSCDEKTIYSWFQVVEAVNQQVEKCNEARGKLMARLAEGNVERVRRLAMLMVQHDVVPTFLDWVS